MNSTIEHIDISEHSCVQAATEILGDKWTPRLILHLAVDGFSGFCQIQSALDDINPRTLSARLSKLEEHGIVTKQCVGSGKRLLYDLTDKGRDLLPVIESMSVWSQKYGLCPLPNSTFGRKSLAN